MYISFYFIVKQDGTLIGTAFVTCFGYWFFASAIAYMMCYVFTSDVTVVQVFSLLVSTVVYSERNFFL